MGRRGRLQTADVLFYIGNARPYMANREVLKTHKLVKTQNSCHGDVTQKKRTKYLFPGKGSKKFRRKEEA